MEFAISAEHQEFDTEADTWINMNLEVRVTTRFKILAGVTFAGEENAFPALPSRRVACIEKGNMAARPTLE